MCVHACQQPTEYDDETHLNDTHVSAHRAVSESRSRQADGEACKLHDAIEAKGESDTAGQLDTRECGYIVLNMYILYKSEINCISRNPLRWA